MLENVTKIIREIVSENDQVFRWGGEEILVLISMDKNNTKKLADEYCTNVNELKFNTDGISFKVSVTGGVHTFTNKDSKDSLIVKTDKALYDGKHNGKNL